jgi:hypothetical protein
MSDVNGHQTAISKIDSDWGWPIRQSLQRLIAQA